MYGSSAMRIGSSSSLASRPGIAPPRLGVGLMIGSMGTPAMPVTPLAHPLSLSASRRGRRRRGGRQAPPALRGRARRFPRGPLVSRGLPFEPPDHGTAGDAGCSSTGPHRIDLAASAATHLVLLALLRRLARRGRPPAAGDAGRAGSLPVGEPLARAFASSATDGTVVKTDAAPSFRGQRGHRRLGQHGLPGPAAPRRGARRLARARTRATAPAASRQPATRARSRSCRAAGARTRPG